MSESQGLYSGLLINFESSLMQLSNFIWIKHNKNHWGEDNLWRLVRKLVSKLLSLQEAGGLDM